MNKCSSCTFPPLCPVTCGLQWDCCLSAWCTWTTGGPECACMHVCLVCMCMCVCVWGSCNSIILWDTSLYIQPQTLGMYTLTCRDDITDHAYTVTRYPCMRWIVQYNKKYTIAGLNHSIFWGEINKIHVYSGRYQSIYIIITLRISWSVWVACVYRLCHILPRQSVAACMCTEETYKNHTHQCMAGPAMPLYTQDLYAWGTIIYSKGNIKFLASLV